MPEPLISVIVPVYNVAPYLKKCLDSILAQTYRHLEIVLVDDGSTDGSGDICDAYARRDDRIKICRQENKGVAAARNSGLDLAGGDYIGFVDPDDWVLPNMYEELLRLIREHTANIAQCGVLLDDHSGEATPEPQLLEINGEELLERTILESLPVVLWCNLYAADIWRGLRFAEGYCYEDEIIFPEITKRCGKFVRTSTMLYNYNRVNTGIVRGIKTMMHLRSKEKSIESYMDFFEKNFVCAELAAFHLCKMIPSYRLIIDKNEYINIDTSIMHNKKMHKLFCSHFAMMRQYRGYKNYPIKKIIYLWTYYFFPQVAYMLLSKYKTSV